MKAQESQVPADRAGVVERLREETYKAMLLPFNHNTPGLDAAVRSYLEVVPKSRPFGVAENARSTRE